MFMFFFHLGTYLAYYLVLLPNFFIQCISIISVDKISEWKCRYTPRRTVFFKFSLISPCVLTRVMKSVVTYWILKWLVHRTGSKDHKLIFSKKHERLLYITTDIRSSIMDIYIKLILLMLFCWTILICFFYTEPLGLSGFSHQHM